MPTISHDEVRAAFTRIKAALSSDPVFEAGDVERLEARLETLPATVGELFSETLAPDPAVHRYAAVLLLADLVQYYAARARAEEPADLLVEACAFRFFRGNLSVQGNLRLGAGAKVVVAGDLNVGGCVLSEDAGVSASPRTAAPALLGVAGSMRAQNVMMCGELLVCSSLVVGDVVYLYGERQAAQVFEVRARTIVENGAGRGNYGRVRAQQHFAESLGKARPDRLRAIGRILGVLGVNSVEQLERSLRSLMRPAA